MKKNYEDPFFEITKFSFEDILSMSDPEEELPTLGDTDDVFPDD